MQIRNSNNLQKTQLTEREILFVFLNVCKINNYFTLIRFWSIFRL